MNTHEPSRFLQRTREARRLGRLFAVVPRIPATRDLAERRFLLSALLEAPEAEEARGLDGEVLLAIAERHAITASIAEHAALLPEPLRARLEERRLETILQNRIMLRDAQEIARALSGAGIEHVFLKGTALRARYAALAARHTDDIDLLIRPDALEGARRALASAGFHEDERLRRMRHPLVTRNLAGSMCEVHVGLEAGLDAATWARASAFEYAGVPLMLPHDEDVVAHLCHHVLVQHAGVPRYLPRHLIDVAAVLEARGSIPTEIPGAGETIELLRLVREWRGSPARATVLAAMLFPVRHSALHLAITRRMQRPSRGLRAELRSLARLPSYLLYRSE